MENLYVQIKAFSRIQGSNVVSCLPNTRVSRFIRSNTYYVKLNVFRMKRANFKLF